MGKRSIWEGDGDRDKMGKEMEMASEMEMGER